MSANFDVEKDNARFYHTFSRVIVGLVVFGCIILVASTYAILKGMPIYMQDWRGMICIVLTLLALAIYVTPVLTMSERKGWPPPLYFSVPIWCSFYLIVLLLSLIDRNFLWDFYLVVSFGFSLFGSRRLLLIVCITVLTMFAFQGLLAWPPGAGTAFTLGIESMTFFSMTGFSMLFQNLVSERFERNKLFQQLHQANAELTEAHRRLEQSVEQEQELAVLRERTRLAREMHDTLGHALVLIAVKLEVAQRLRERDPERCDRELESTKEIARESMTALRASIADLRSPALERESIQRVLGHSVRELAQRTGLHVSSTVEGDIENLPASIQETLWKVSQEALANIEKHAQAQHVNLRISHQDRQVVMTVQDDGIGLPEAYYRQDEDASLLLHSPNGHYGLRGMRERAEGLGGSLTLRSSKEQGTVVEIALPLAERDGEPVPSESML